MHISHMPGANIVPGEKERWKSQWRYDPQKDQQYSPGAVMTLLFNRKEIPRKQGLHKKNYPERQSTRN
jgi:hypothetical protein